MLKADSFISYSCDLGLLLEQGCLCHEDGSSCLAGQRAHLAILREMLLLTMLKTIQSEPMWGSGWSPVSSSSPDIQWMLNEYSLNDWLFNQDVIGETLDYNRCTSLLVCLREAHDFTDTCPCMTQSHALHLHVHWGLNGFSQYLVSKTPQLCLHLLELLTEYWSYTQAVLIYNSCAQYSDKFIFPQTDFNCSTKRNINRIFRKIY